MEIRPWGRQLTAASWFEGSLHNHRFPAAGPELVPAAATIPSRGGGNAMRASTTYRGPDFFIGKNVKMYASWHF